MERKVIRLTKVQSYEERELAARTNDVLDEWLTKAIEDLEFRLRYSKEETQTLQGALRVLDDIKGILKR